MIMYVHIYVYIHIYIYVYYVSIHVYTYTYDMCTFHIQHEVQLGATRGTSHLQFVTNAAPSGFSKWRSSESRGTSTGCSSLSMLE